VPSPGIFARWLCHFGTDWKAAPVPAASLSSTMKPTLWRVSSYWRPGFPSPTINWNMTQDGWRVAARPTRRQGGGGFDGSPRAFSSGFHPFVFQPSPSRFQDFPAADDPAKPRRMGPVHHRQPPDLMQDHAVRRFRQRIVRMDGD